MATRPVGTVGVENVIDPKDVPRAEQLALAVQQGKMRWSQLSPQDQRNINLLWNSVSVLGYKSFQDYFQDRGQLPKPKPAVAPKAQPARKSAPTLGQRIKGIEGAVANAPGIKQAGDILRSPVPAWLRPLDPGGRPELRPSPGETPDQAARNPKDRITAPPATTIGGVIQDWLDLVPLVGPAGMVGAAAGTAKTVGKAAEETGAKTIGKVAEEARPPVEPVPTRPAPSYGTFHVPSPLDRPAPHTYVPPRPYGTFGMPAPKPNAALTQAAKAVRTASGTLAKVKPEAADHSAVLANVAAAHHEARQAIETATAQIDEDVSNVVRPTSAFDPNETAGHKLYTPISGGAVEPTGPPFLQPKGFAAKWVTKWRAAKGSFQAYGWNDLAADTDVVSTDALARQGNDMTALLHAGLNDLSTKQWNEYLAWKRYGTVSRDPAVVRFYNTTESIFGAHQQEFQKYGQVVAQRTVSEDIDGKLRFKTEYVPFAEAKVAHYTPEYLSPRQVLKYSPQEIKAMILQENPQLFRNMDKLKADEIAGELAQWLHDRASGKFSSDIPVDVLRRMANQTRMRSLIARVNWHVPSTLLVPQRDAIVKYIKDSSMELAANKVWGPNDEKVINRIMQAPLSFAEKKRLIKEFDIARGKAYDDRLPGDEIFSSLSNIAAGTLISVLTGIKHLDRLTIPLLREGPLNLAKGIVQALSASGKVEAEQVGVQAQSLMRSLQVDMGRIYDPSDPWKDIVEKTGKLAQANVKWSGLPMFDNFIRRASYFAAKNRINSLLEAASTGNPHAVRELRGTYHLDQWANESTIKAAIRKAADDEAVRTRMALEASQRTNPFSANPFEHSRFIRSGAGKMLFSLRMFDLQFWGMIKDYVLAPLNRNDIGAARKGVDIILRMAKVAGVSAAAGAAINSTLDGIAHLMGRPSGQPYGSLSDVVALERQKASLGLALRWLGWQIMTGAVFNLFGPFVYGTGAYQLPGAGLSQVLNLTGAGISAAKGAINLASGDPKRMKQGREQLQSAAHRAIAHVPVVGGPLAHYVIPSPRLDAQQKALEIARARLAGQLDRAEHLQATWGIPEKSVRAAVKKIQEQMK